MSRGSLLRVLMAATLLGAAGCHNMLPIRPAEIDNHTWPKIWVTTTDHPTFVLEAPAMRGDTLYGFVDGDYREIPLPQVVTMRGRRGARTRTAAVIGTSFLAMTGLLVYFGNRSYVGGNATTCSSGNTTGDVADNLPVPCCRVNPTIPC